MVTKTIKTVVIVAVGAFVAGSFMFGGDLVSYVKSSARSVQTAVKDSVPIEFELRRARDLLEEIIPEMHANIRLIAKEEVEVAALKQDITQSKEALTDQKETVAKLRNKLEMHNANFTFSGQEYSRQQVSEELSRRFEMYKESEMVLAGKERLLQNREKSLQAAVQLLDRTRSQKQLLQDKIEGLESQYRLIKASAVGSSVQIDNSKLAQTEKLIDEINKRLDVAERVIAHENKLETATFIPMDTIDEAELLTQVDEHFNPTTNDETELRFAQAETVVTPVSEGQ